MEIRTGLSSKLFAFTFGWGMLEAMPWMPGVSKSRSILLWLPPLPTIIVEASWALVFCSFNFNFFLLEWKTPVYFKIEFKRKVTSHISQEIPQRSPLYPCKSKITKKKKAQKMLSQYIKANLISTKWPPATTPKTWHCRKHMGIIDWF